METQTRVRDSAVADLVPHAVPSSGVAQPRRYALAAGDARAVALRSRKRRPSGNGDRRL